jgi:hypothetical protein
MAEWNIEDSDIQRYLDGRPDRRYPLAGVKMESMAGSRRELAAYRQLYFELGRDRVEASPEFVDRVCARVDEKARREKASEVAVTVGVAAAVVAGLVMAIAWLQVGWGELLTPVRGLAERVDSSVVVALAWSGALVQEYALLLAALAFLGVVAAGDYLVERLRGQTRLFSV